MLQGENSAIRSTFIKLPFFIKIFGLSFLSGRFTQVLLYPFKYCYLLFCQPRVEVTSCFVYKVMGLTFHDRINTQLIYRFELAQVVARRITKPQRKFLGSNLTGCSFFLFSFFFSVFGGGGGGGV